MGRPLEVDLTGQRFSRLVVVGRAPNRGNKVRWDCRCDCGATCYVQTFDLVFGKTQSCGCYRRDRQKSIHSKTNVSETTFILVNDVEQT